MIDFEINNLGDICLEKQEKTSPFKLNFTTSDNYPKMKIDFRTFTPETKHKNALKINIATDNKYPVKDTKYIRTVNGKKEQAQSIAIRLKTELGELQDFLYDFGSELNRIRHTDIKLTESKKNKIIDYVEKAISDIFNSSEVNIDVERIFTESGNFGLETLKITIKTLDGEIVYTYTV